MGNTNHGLSQELLNDYLELTYLKKADIIKIYLKFCSVAQDKFIRNIHYRIKFKEVQEEFKVLKYNPFADRICEVFSSLKDGCFSFEDVLDLCSVMSKYCPPEVKAEWAFLIFDFNDDKQIGSEDIYEIMKRLTASSIDKLSDTEQSHIVEEVMNIIDLQSNGCISRIEFLHAVKKLPDFPVTFTFNI